MVLREWMVPHEWMVKYTPQTEWIERRGILVWIAEVFGSLGPGLYLVSLFYDNLWIMEEKFFFFFQLLQPYGKIFIIENNELYRGLLLVEKNDF